MSDIGDLHDDASRDAAAAEYVLGTLSDADRVAFERALRNEPESPSGPRAAPLHAAVYAWQDRLLGLAANARPIAPAARVWTRIDSAVADPTASSASARAVGDRAPWFKRVSGWPGAGAFALAAAVLMTVVLVERPAPDASVGERYLALLQSPSTQATGWVVEIEAGRQLQLIPIASGDAVPAGKAWQFWTKPQGATAPTSLGLVAAGRSIRLPVARLPGVGASQLFEITLEPSAGSPIGKPTGPILYVGRTIHL